MSQFQKYIDLIEECTKQDETYIASSTGFIRGMLTDLKNEYRKLEQQKVKAKKILTFYKVEMLVGERLTAKGPTADFMHSLLGRNVIDYEELKIFRGFGELFGFEVIVEEEK